MTILTSSDKGFRSPILAACTFLTANALVLTGAIAQPSYLLDGILFDVNGDSWIKPDTNGSTTSLLMETMTGEIAIASWKKGNHAANDGGVLLYGSPISVILGAEWDGSNDSSFGIWKESVYYGPSGSPLFKVDGLTGNTTFTGSNVSVNSGSLSVGGSAVLTASSAS